MNKKVKVSVLVPIYNVEKFLPECLNSLVNQTLKDIEIICINDGSTDNSLEIIEKYAKNDPRIIIVNKKNSGYGDSMNKGLEKARGEYVGIVESDDFIDLDAFEKLYNLAQKNRAEVVKSNFYEYLGSTRKDIGKSNMFLSNEVEKIIDPKNNHHIFYQQPSIWAAIYKRDFLKNNKISFLPSPGASYQDASFNFKVWASTHRALFTNRAFLHYRQDNTNSSVKSSGKVYCVKDEYDEVERFLKEKGAINDYGFILATVRFSSYIWNMHRLTHKTALEFAKTVKNDYWRLKKEGVLQLKNSNVQEKIDLSRSFAIRHPKIYIYLRPFHAARNNLKKFFKNLKKNYSSSAES